VAIVYSTAAITARLNGVISAIDGGGGPGQLQLLAGAIPLAIIPLATPSGTAAAGILTFTGGVFTVAIAAGVINVVNITDATGAVMVSGLTVGIPFSGANVIVNNALNTLQVNVGQQVTLVSGQIIGS